MRHGRWYLVFHFEDILAHKRKAWTTRTEHVLLTATDPEAAFKEFELRWKEQKGKRFKAREPYEKGPLEPKLVYKL